MNVIESGILESDSGVNLSAWKVIVDDLLFFVNDSGDQNGWGL